MSPAARRILEDRDDYERGRRSAHLDREVLARALVVSIHAPGPYGQGYREGLREALPGGLDKREEL